MYYKLNLILVRIKFAKLYTVPSPDVWRHFILETHISSSVMYVPMTFFPEISRKIIVSMYFRCNFFLHFFDFMLLNPLKSCHLISHTQKSFKFSFTLPVESSITFLNLVLAVLKWAVGQFKNANRRLYKESRAKLKYVPWLGDYLASF